RTARSSWWQSRAGAAPTQGRSCDRFPQMSDEGAGAAWKSAHAGRVGAALHCQAAKPCSKSICAAVCVDRCGDALERLVLRIRITDCGLPFCRRRVALSVDALRLSGECLEPACVFSRLSQEPSAEGGDFGKPGCRLGAHDPVILGQSQHEVKWSDQAPIDEVPSGKCSAGKGYPLAISGSVYHHARTIQHWTMCGLGSRHTGGLKPFRPILSIVEMQQRELQHIPRLAQAVASRKEFGTADRKQLLGTKAPNVEPSPIAVTMPNRKIDFLSGEVYVMHGR